ncbi:hypothetical protein [Pseudocolwellia agarivorans]|uniref:hypothetical protein n=1 Tax=Pseudocolwellia agarivorans TaxID=1911682 RepID=UPI0009866F01|nr:hypothetical protein [Pseudocolwellia agarivorans]
MSFKSHIPFHRQISGSLIFLFSSILLIVGIISFLFYQRNIQVNELITKQLPQYEYTREYQRLVFENNEYFLSLKNSETASELTSVLALIQQNIDNISRLPLINGRKVGSIAAEVSRIKDIVNRIKINEPRNEVLKNTAIVQLRLLINNLIEQIENKTQDQIVLHHKVTINGENGYIPAGNAIKYIEVTKILSQLNKSLILFDEAILGFESVSINKSVDSFDTVTKKIDLAVSTWLSVLTSEPMDIAIRNRIEELQTLLNVDQRVLAKWYSHLRLAEEVFNRIKEVNQTLNELYISDNKRVKFTSSQYIVPPFIANTLEKVSYELSAKHYYYGLIAGVLVSLVLILLILLKLKSRIKAYGENTVNLCENLLAGDDKKQEQADYVTAAEHLRIVGLIHQIQKPEHSENQYQSLVDTQHNEFSFIYKNHGIAIWQYQPFSQYIHLNEDILRLASSPNNKVNHWRQLITAQSLSEVIIVAKNVRDSQITQSCQIKTKNNIVLEMFIGFDGTRWFGTLSRNEKSEQLKNTIVSLKNRLKTVEAHSIEELTTTTDRFSKMVLRAMLQSQGSSVDVNGSSLPVYRQLTRIFDWCRQSNIVTRLQQSPRQLNNTDISFKDELHAIVFNAISEAHLQRNQIYLLTDRLLLNYTSVDHRLFHRMLLGVIRVTLAELFNAKMLLGLKVIDRDTGSQTVQFTLTVSPVKKLKQLPNLVSRLVNEDIKSASISDIIFYIKTLMQRFNINQIESELQDDGFKVMFSMLLVEQKHSLLEQTLKTSSLKQRSIVSVSACSFLQKAITHAINAADGTVFSINSIDDFTKNYSAEILSSQPIALIIIGDDVSRLDYENIKKHINHLPEKQKPKLLVMQSPVNSAYHKEGLYNQSSMPLCQSSFQARILELLASDSSDNMLVEAEVLSEYQYQSTRVEVLLAVSVPEEHQLLIRILQWLGLKVHVVSQPIAMVKHWQSGRYLILMSEFERSPFIMLAAGQNILRGVFTFKDILFDTPTGNLLKATKHWKVSTLPQVLDIKALIVILTPWLKSKAVHIGVKEKAVATVNEEQSFDAFLDETNKLDDSDKEYINYSQTFIAEETDYQPSDILDMEKYAFNQGSSELAAYMIDEYIDDLDKSITSLEKAIEKHEFNQTAKPIQIILKVSEVMAAKNIHTSCLSLKEMMDDAPSETHMKKYRATIEYLRSHLKSLKAYTDAI